MPGSAYPPSVQVVLLGPAGASTDGTPVALGTRKQRALLAALALHRGRPVAVDTLVDLLWADRPPEGVAGTLQGYVAGLRRALEPDRPSRAPATVLVTAPPGYALRLPPEDLDVTRFEMAVSRVRERVGSLAAVPSGAPGPSPDELREAAATLDDALGLWRGTPFQELDDAPAAVAERVRLEELRLVALEDRAAAGIALGDHATVVAELEALTAAHPLRERLWALRAVALTRSGRQAEALQVLQQVRRLLVDELGIEPGPELRELQTAVLRQDPALTTAVARPAVTASSAPQLVGEQRWPMVGRTHELDRLAAVLDAAASGTPSFAVLVGEPGMGKSRLAEELAAIATARGAQVLVGRCSQDEGAPPLWPWASVLAGLGHDLPVDTGTEDESTRFRSWDTICATLLEASGDQTLLVVLDDLHWADVSSLRVLGLLLETARHGRLAVLATWRDRPPPTGALAAVADGFARRHALRLHLDGLDACAVAEVVRAVSSTAPSPRQADALRTRTEGNPFFLVEYARLVGRDGDLTALLAEAHPPAAVHDVLRRRVSSLPEPTAQLLRLASVVGRDFDLTTLSAVAGVDEDGVLDALEPAVEAGLVVDGGGDRFRFGHALVRDTAYASLSPSRRSRAHRRVAEHLEGAPGRETEVALHWAASGAAHAGRAWRAATAAAEQARSVYAYDEAEDMLRQALALLEQDPGATERDEYDVLLHLATTVQLAGKWLDLRRAVHRMIELADRIGDVGLLARAAVMPGNGALWQAAAHGHVDEPTAAALRRALAELPPDDGPLRCRALLSLASEIYYGVSAQEREALVEQGLAMARRLEDPALLLSACLIGFVSTWRPATATSRLALAEEAVAIARELDDDSALTSTLTVRAVVAAELGDVDTMERVSEEARRRAVAHRQLYSLVVLDSLEVSWLAMRGRFEEAEAMAAHLAETGAKMAIEQYADALPGALLSIGMWRGQCADLVPLVRDLEQDSRLPVRPAVAVVMIRAGLVEEARAYVAEHALQLEGDSWYSMLPWSFAGEIGAALGDRRISRDAYALLAPYAGRCSSAGSGVAVGPVDTFLALAAAGAGDRELAARHATDALELCRAWRIPLAEQWLLDQRARYGF